MEAFYIPTENDFRKWIKEAVRECLETEHPVNISLKENETPLISHKKTTGKLGISLVILAD